MALFTTALGLYGGVLWSDELRGFIIHETVPTPGSRPCGMCYAVRSAFSRWGGVGVLAAAAAFFLGAALGPCAGGLVLVLLFF
jgi:hypothetical protein